MTAPQRSYQLIHLCQFANLGSEQLREIRSVELKAGGPITNSKPTNGMLRFKGDMPLVVAALTAAPSFSPPENGAASHELDLSR